MGLRVGGVKLSGAEAPERGVQRGIAPSAGGRGGVPHKRTGRMGGKNYVCPAQLRKGPDGVRGLDVRAEQRGAYVTSAPYAPLPPSATLDP